MKLIDELLLILPVAFRLGRGSPILLQDLNLLEAVLVLDGEFVVLLLELVALLDVELQLVEEVLGFGVLGLRLRLEPCDFLILESDDLEELVGGLLGCLESEFQGLALEDDVVHILGGSFGGAVVGGVVI